MTKEQVGLVALGGGTLIGYALGKKQSAEVSPAVPPDIAQSLANTAAALQEATGRLATITDRLGQIAESIGRLSALALQGSVISLPMDPKAISKIVQGFGVPGESEFPLYSTAVLAPASTETTFIVAIPTGFVGMVVEPILISSEYYSSDITGKVIVDDVKVVTPIPYYFTEPASISLGEWYTVRQNITIIMTNNTGVDVTMTVQAQVALLQVSFYEEWFRPVLKASWDALNNLAELMGGKKR
jgi:hypothetical protein